MRFRIIDRLIAKRSLALCWNAGLHPRDALHVAVALEEGCDVLETRDGKLLRNNGLEGLTVREPFWESQTDISDDQGLIGVLERDANRIVGTLRRRITTRTLRPSTHPIA